MKTIQEYLAAADRERVLKNLSYRFLEDPLHLLELEECTIKDIQKRYSDYMNGFIEQLLSIEAARSDSHVFYLYTSYEKGEILDLIDMAEIAADIKACGHDFSFTDWRESLGFLVADTKLTQDYLTDLLAQYIEGVSCFGTDEASRTAKLGEIFEQLDEGMRSFQEGEAKSAEEVFEELRKEHGFPAREKDPSQDALRDKVTVAVAEFEQYCRIRERERILGNRMKK